MARLTREALESMGVGAQLPPRAGDPIVDHSEGLANASKRESGRAAASLGAAFEDDLDRTHAALRVAGVADIARLPVDTAPAPGRISDPTGKIRPGQLRVLRQRQSFDYRGVLKGGRSIAVEAKATTSRKTSIKIGPGGIRPHQLDALADQYARFNQIGIVVWRNGPDRLVLLPGAVIEAHHRFSIGERKSIPASAFARYRLVGGLESYLEPLGI